MSAPEPDLTRQAAELFSDGRYNEAERLFERVADAEPENWQVLLMLGLCRRALKQYEAALKALARAAEIGDGHSAPHYYHGRQLAELERNDEAREALVQAVALDPNHFEARTMLGLISIERGDLPRAIKELRIALRARADHVPALAALARALVLSGEVEEAERLAGQAVQLNPNLPSAQDAMARVYLAQGQVDFAEQALRNALKLAPQAGELHGGLASVLRHKGQDREALVHYREAIRRNYGGSTVVLNAVSCLMRIGDRQQAWQLLEQARNKWPKDRALTLRSAEIQLLEGEPAAARERIAEVDDGTADIALLKARTAHALGEIDEAHAQLTELQGHPEPRVAREARLMAGRLKMIDGDLDGVGAALDPLMQTATPDPDAVLLWVEACRTLQRFDRACEPLERLLASPEIEASDHARLHQMLAQLYDRADQPDDARRHLDQTAWTVAPHARVLAPQHGTGLIERWLNHEWRAEEFEVPDDGLPTPVLLAGWPGAGRELIAAAVSADPSFRSLDPEGARRRREALDIPMSPEEAEALPEATLHTGRRRFLRGFEGSRSSGPVVDYGWWEATAIPVLARYFPELVVLVPEADPRDLELFWRLNGYAAVDELRAAWEQEQRLMEQVESHLSVRFVRIPRADLTGAPDRAVKAVCDALGGGNDAAMLQALQTAARQQALPAEGRWKAYPDLFPDRAPE